MDLVEGRSRRGGRVSRRAGGGQRCHERSWTSCSARRCRQSRRIRVSPTSSRPSLRRATGAGARATMPGTASQRRRSARVELTPPSLIRPRRAPRGRVAPSLRRRFPDGLRVGRFDGELAGRGRRGRTPIGSRAWPGADRSHIATSNVDVDVRWRDAGPPHPPRSPAVGGPRPRRGRPPGAQPPVTRWRERVRNRAWSPT